MNFGKSILGAVLTLTLVTSVTAPAAEKTCVEVFKDSKEKFEAKMSALQTRQNGANMVTGTSAVFGLICLMTKGKWIVKGACATAFAGFAGAGAFYSSTTSAKMSRLHDAYRLYLIYEATALNQQDPAFATTPAGKESQLMIKNLEKELQKEDGEKAEQYRAKLQKAPEQFATLMEFGKFCEGGLPTYGEAMRVMKEWLHAPAQ